MPSLNQFFHKPELIRKEELQSIHGIKPCSKCKEDAEEAFWDPATLTLSWECPSGHKNQVRVE